MRGGQSSGQGRARTIAAAAFCGKPAPAERVCLPVGRKIVRMMMRAIPLLLLLTGCGLTPEAWVTLFGGVGIGTVAVLGKTPIDVAFSTVTGRDCSGVRLEKGQSYCRREEPPPQPPPFCTRSLGVVNCWQDPASLPPGQRSVADGPRALTPAQEADRTRTWPF